MANGFTIEQVGQEHTPAGQSDWLYEFQVTYNERSWYFPIMVSASEPSATRLEQAKNQLKAFVAALSDAVQAW